MIIVLAVAAAAAGVIATLATLVLLMAGCANSKPRQYMWLKRMMLGVALFGVASAVAAAWLIVAGEPAWAAAAGGAPVVACTTLIVVLWKIEF